MFVTGRLTRVMLPEKESDFFLRKSEAPTVQQQIVGKFARGHKKGYQNLNVLQSNQTKRQNKDCQFCRFRQISRRGSLDLNVFLRSLGAHACALTRNCCGFILSPWLYVGSAPIHIKAARKPHPSRGARTSSSLKMATLPLLDETLRLKRSAICRQVPPAGRMKGSSLSQGQRSSGRSLTFQNSGRPAVNRASCVSHRYLPS